MRNAFMEEENKFDSPNVSSNLRELIRLEADQTEGNVLLPSSQ
jgi:hypothetical protein